MKAVILFFLLTLLIPSLAQTNGSNNSKESMTNYGLMFEKEVEYRLADSSYKDIIQLLKLGDKAQAIQFRLSFNKAPDDSKILIFQDIQKGSDLDDNSWLLDYNIVEGSRTGEEGLETEIYIVLYCLNQDDGLLPGDFKNLLTVEYKLVALPNQKNHVKSSLKISHAEASTFKGDAIDITSNQDEFKVYLKRK
jgi:hypothetical protein